MKQLNQSPLLVVSFDESLNKKTQTYQVDLLIRYWNEEKIQVEVKYWDSSFMGHCTSHYLKNHFNERISDHNLNKILQVSTDGLIVNLKFHRDVRSNREGLKLPKHIDIGSCSQHTIHDAFKAGLKSIDWEIKKTFKGCCTLLNDSPSRSIGNIVFPLSFCSIRWFKDKKMAERLISFWSSVVKIFNHWESLPNKSYEFVVNAVKNELSLARLQFFN